MRIVEPQSGQFGEEIFSLKCFEQTGIPSLEYFVAKAPHFAHFIIQSFFSKIKFNTKIFTQKIYVKYLITNHSHKINFIDKYKKF